ncbi:protein farnesyltransferase subunit beta [Nematocida displodere]|uniref:Protein farnesyltransferase subunit beta n=1 Tax=Nematocida displodere TaxID=1805483 RepID=A0A177EI57_9MICR|nr:protein farnesyltransferase subunit beta [Nematocida displodere]
MYNDEGFETKTSKDASKLNDSLTFADPEVLNMNTHLEYLLKEMETPQNTGYCALMPWIASWLANAFFVVLGRERFYQELSSGRLTKLNEVAEALLDLQTTGISGGPGQLPNLGNTYAALSFLKTVNRINEVRKNEIVAFIKEMQVSNGFTMHRDGEVDARSLYSAIASYSMLYSETVGETEQMNPLASEEGRALFGKAHELIYATQSYEGGFSSLPEEEAHGGYTFCALASLTILQKAVPNQDLLKKWLHARQDPISKGLSGRTNKLVDTCYNYWVGACFKLLGCTEYSAEGLVKFTLTNCQGREGGLKPSPDSHTDIYHTAYALTGLYLLGADDFNSALGIPTTAQS